MCVTGLPEPQKDHAIRQHAYLHDGDTSVSFSGIYASAVAEVSGTSLEILCDDTKAVETLMATEGYTAAMARFALGRYNSG
jgi:hypothetical protein